MKARDGGGVLITQAIHTLDLFRWLVGIERVEAAQVRTTALHRMETEDYASALVRLGNGAPGTIIATVAAYPGSPEWIHIIGSKGTARLEGGSLRLAFVDGREEVLADTSGSGSGASVMASRTRRIGRCSAISSTRSSRDATRRFPARRRWRPSA